MAKPTAFSCNFWSITMRDFVTFANFITSQCKQTHVCVDKVVKRPEDPFPRICEGFCPWLKPERCECSVGRRSTYCFTAVVLSASASEASASASASASYQLLGGPLAQIFLGGMLFVLQVIIFWAQGQALRAFFTEMCFATIWSRV